MRARTIDFRYVVMRNDADYTTLIPAEGGEPVLRCDDKAEIHMSLSGEFLPNSQVNWMTDRIRPELIIDGVRHPLGIYLPASAEEIENGTESTISVESYDQCWLLKDWKTEGMVSVPSSIQYIAAVKNFLLDAGIVLVSATPKDLSPTNTKEGWEIGTSHLAIINELLAEINYKALWFDANGIAILEPATVPDVQHIQHILDATDPDCLILPGISRSTDIYSAPNVFVVVCEAPERNGEPMVSKAENTNPESPLSIPARGRRIVKYEKIKGIANQDELDAYAQRRLSLTMLAGETIKVQTALKPGWGVGDVTAINYGDVQTICVEHSWEMQLQVGGSMTHTLERIVINT